MVENKKTIQIYDEKQKTFPQDQPSSYSPCECQFVS